jgi:hypothetical protein
MSGFFGHTLLQNFAFGAKEDRETTVLYLGSMPSRGVESRDTVASTSELLSESSLGNHLKLDDSIKILVLEERVLSQVGAVHLLDLLLFKELAKTVLVSSSVGGVACQVLGSVVDEGVDQLLWNSTEAEASKGDAVSISDVFGGLVGG